MYYLNSHAYPTLHNHAFTIYPTAVILTMRPNDELLKQI